VGEDFGKWRGSTTLACTFHFFMASLLDCRFVARTQRGPVQYEVEHKQSWQAAACHDLLCVGTAENSTVNFISYALAVVGAAVLLFCWP